MKSIGSISLNKITTWFPSYQFLLLSKYKDTQRSSVNHNENDLLLELLHLNVQFVHKTLWSNESKSRAFLFVGGIDEESLSNRSISSIIILISFLYLRQIALIPHQLQRSWW